MRVCDLCRGDEDICSVALVEQRGRKTGSSLVDGELCKNCRQSLKGASLTELICQDLEAERVIDVEEVP